MADTPAPQSSVLMSWLRLMRLPTVFTALSNVFCGFFVSTTERDLAVLIARRELWLLLLSSIGLYLGGMVLNDVFDVSLDARERPERPIPSGKVSQKSAAIFGGLLMVFGILAAVGADAVSATGHTSVQLACVLAAIVVLYDSVLKSTVAGPIAMAGCRFLNILLGASCAGTMSVIFSGPQIWIAIALFVYIVGVTFFARNEAGDSSVRALAGSLVIVGCGIAVYVVTAARTLNGQSPAVGALIALALIAGNIFIRAVAAIRVNQPRLLQKTVGFMLLNIIFLDAAMTFCMTGSGRIAAMVVILVIPATMMKRVIPLS